MSYIAYFLLTLVLSTLFAMGGVGSAIALVPILHFFGLEFNLSKAIGLFVNTSTTITATIMNIKRRVLDVRFAFPLAISLALFAPIGAYFSKVVPENLVKSIFIVFLFLLEVCFFLEKKIRNFIMKRCGF
nr:sulfite exporter TauE/SafE family protein [Nitratiruptor tergarcus]